MWLIRAGTVVKQFGSFIFKLMCVSVFAFGMVRARLAHKTPYEIHVLTFLAMLFMDTNVFMSIKHQILLVKQLSCIFRKRWGMGQVSFWHGHFGYRFPEIRSAWIWSASVYDSTPYSIAAGAITRPHRFWSTSKTPFSSLFLHILVLSVLLPGWENPEVNWLMTWERQNSTKTFYYDFPEILIHP